MSSCRYHWSPASMVIACGHSAFLHWGFQLMASKVQWCKHMSTCWLFLETKNRKEKALVLQGIISLPFNSWSCWLIFYHYFLVPRIPHLPKKYAFFLCKYVETCVSSLLHIIDS
jgi:hypothetical protein